MFGEMQSSSKFPCIVQRYVRERKTLKLHRLPTGYGSRFYIHSRNAADAMMFILRHREPYIHMPGVVDKPDRYNIVGDLQIDNRELVELIADELNLPYSFEDVNIGSTRPGHDMHYGVDGNKLAAIGWKSPLSFEESMRRTVRWYEENPEWLDPK